MCLRRSPGLTQAQSMRSRSRRLGVESIYSRPSTTCWSPVRLWPELLTKDRRGEGVAHTRTSERPQVPCRFDGVNSVRRGGSTREGPVPKTGCCSPAQAPPPRHVRRVLPRTGPARSLLERRERPPGPTTIRNKTQYLFSQQSPPVSGSTLGPPWGRVAKNGPCTHERGEVAPLAQHTDHNPRPPPRLRRRLRTRSRGSPRTRACRASSCATTTASR